MNWLIELFIDKNDNSLTSQQKKAIKIAILGALFTFIISLVVSWNTALPLISATTSVAIAFIADRINQYGNNNKIEDKFNRMDGTNLNYLGDVHEGIKWIIDNCHGAERVKNTAFNRSDPNGQPKIDRLSTIMLKSMRKTIQSGCSWTDLYLPSEEEEINKFHETLGDKTSKSRHVRRIINTEIPLQQMLIVRFRSGDRAVLFGWGSPGSETSNVYISHSQEAFNYFNEYFELLLEKSEPYRPVNMPIVPPSPKSIP